MQPIAGLHAPCQRPCDVDDIIAPSGWILFVPGDAKPDPEVDPAYLLQLEAAIGKIQRPFRGKADAKPGRDQRHQRIGVIAAEGNVGGEVVFRKLLIEVSLGCIIAFRPSRGVEHAASLPG